MPEPIVIDDPGDPRVADFVGLTDAELRRHDDGVFVAEGVLAIERLVASAYPVRAVLATPNRVDRLAPLVTRRAGTPLYVASQDVMNEVAGFDIHRGALASADRLPLPPLPDLVATARRVAVLEGITDTENMGALFRNAAAFGIDVVVLSAECCDPLYRRSVRVSLGHVLHVPFTRTDAPAVDELAGLGFCTVGLTPHPGAEDIAAFAANPPDRVALLLGAEGDGLRPETLAAAHRRVRIPISDAVDSLNVATAAAIAFHRLWR